MSPSRQARLSPRPSQAGFALSRRSMLKGMAGAGALATMPGIIAACGSDDDTAASGDFELGAGSGDLSIGSNYSNELPQQGLAAAVAAIPNGDINAMINEVDHNTFQENISTYLQNPDDVIPWFAGYRMQFFAEQGLLGDITDVWDAGLDGELSSGFKTASTGLDGNQYFVPWTYYAWGIYYRPSLWEENGWTPPTTVAELTDLAADMEGVGITPFAFANDGFWPAMGTFDQLNFRINGYQFHVDLMAGRESWTDDRVKEVFATWESLLPTHQSNPNGRTWEEAAAAVVNKEAAMMTIGTFIGSQFPEDEVEDLDFFPFPEINSEHGLSVVEAPIDGWMMAADPANGQAAKEMLYHFGTGVAQDAYLAEDPSVVAPSSSVNTSVWSDLQNKVFDTVQNAEFVTQFLDRDTSPEFASNVAGPRIADFLNDPSSIDSVLEDMQSQAEVLLGE
ncbi:MAG: ABC transporter substrate-binding protein [Actinomycetota bacterium]